MGEASVIPSCSYRPGRVDRLRASDGWHGGSRPLAATPQVRRFHTRLVSRADTDEFIDAQIETVRAIGCGYAVVERKADGAVVGDVGIRPVPDHMPIAGDVHFEIGWQLDPQYFG